MSDVTKLLDKLSWHFEDLLERQETMLEVCRAQGQAARAHDMEYLEAKTAALTLLIQENAEAEQERLALVKELVAALQLPVEAQTLSGLIEAAPAPYAKRLADFQARMRATLAETRAVVRENNFILRRSMKVVGDAVNTLARCLPAQSGQYDQRGDSPAARGAMPALLDSRG